MAPRSTRPVRAVVFDLLSALLDSWSLWDDVAGGGDAGRRWRRAYLGLAAAAGRYRAYEALVAEAAAAEGLPDDVARELFRRWDEVRPWPEAGWVLAALARRVPLAVVTNCSESLGRRAAVCAGGRFAVVITAESVGWYKPRPEPYRAALAALGVDAADALFVAGSPYDVEGAAAVGMRVYWHDRLGLSSTLGRTPAEHVSARLSELPDVL